MSDRIGCVSVGNFLQEEFAVRRAGELASRFGRRAFIVGGGKSLEAAGGSLTDSLGASGISSSVNELSGFVSYNKVNALSEKFRSSGADMVIGVGGGRAMDTAKGIANTVDCPVMLVPTSAATCACFAAIAVIYEDNGDPLEDPMPMKRAIDAVLIDTDIIARKCPPRMLASGIADSLAKYAEIMHLRACVPGWTQNWLPLHSWQMALTVRDIQLKHAKAAYDDVSEGRLTKTVEDVIAANIILTGYSSLWGYSTYNMSLAHSVYYAMCGCCKPQQANYMHGELVSLGLPVQLMLNGAPQSEIDELTAMLRSINAPVLPSDVGLTPTDDVCRTIANYCRFMDFYTEDVAKRAEKCLRSFWGMK